ncbi:hypothetical protein GOV04_03865 [Candidatus Woesearchaeota archaeon]|nr:hypothetical protein [Candidatus Woesearchaeota archaeon]
MSNENPVNKDVSAMIGDRTDFTDMEYLPDLPDLIELDDPQESQNTTVSQDLIDPTGFEQKLLGLKKTLAQKKQIAAKPSIDQEELIKVEQKISILQKEFLILSEHFKKIREQLNSSQQAQTSTLDNDMMERLRDELLAKEQVLEGGIQSSFSAIRSQLIDFDKRSQLMEEKIHEMVAYINKLAYILKTIGQKTKEKK